LWKSIPSQTNAESRADQPPVLLLIWWDRIAAVDGQSEKSLGVRVPSSAPVKHPPAIRRLKNAFFSKVFGKIVAKVVDEAQLIFTVSQLQ
jgi:hypothetical protein